MQITTHYLLNHGADNDYFVALNKEFNLGIACQLSPDLDTTIEDNPPVDIGIKYKWEQKSEIVEELTPLFSIIPFEEDQDVDLLEVTTLVTKYQLVSYKYIPATRNSPPDCEDKVIGNYNNPIQALFETVQTLLKERVNNIFQYIAENKACEEMDAAEQE